MSLRLQGPWPTRLLCPWNSPGNNTGAGSHSLLQGIFLTQGSNPGLLYYRQILYHLSHRGSLVMEQLRATPEMAAHQAPLFVGFSRQEHWSGLPFPSPCMKVKSESEVSQSCPTLRDSMNCSLPGSSFHGIFQARVLEWVAIAFSELSSKESACQAGDPVSISESGRYPGEGNGNLLQYSCLKNPMDRGAWQVLAATVHGATKSWT